MEQAARGAAALQASDSLSAVTAYTKALIEHPNSPDYFVQRSTAFTRLKAPYGPRYDLALEDAEFAVLLGQKRAKREKIQAGQQRRVIALFSLERYGDADFVLETMVKWRGKENKKDQMEGQMWKAKIDNKLKNLSEHDEKREVTVNEYPETTLPSESALKAKLQDQLTANGNFKLGSDPDDAVDAVPRSPYPETGALSDARRGSTTQIISTGANESTDSINPKNIKVDREAIIAYEDSTTPTTEHAPPTISKVRHEWYQNNQAVTLTLYAKGVPKEKADFDIQPDSIYLSFPHSSNPSTSFTFTLDPLFASINPEKSKCSILSTKLELYLHKKVPGQKWSTLEGSGNISQSAATTNGQDEVVAPASSAPATAPVYPTSSRSGPKDWDKVAADLGTKKKKKQKNKAKAKGKSNESENEPKEDGEGHESDKEASGSDSGIDSDEGGDAVDGFFKKLYAGADDDTKRAMMKSYQESGGTALSTNWAEVGRGRVEPVAPRDD